VCPSRLPACQSSRQRSVVAQGKLQSEIARALGKHANL
jgi:hypothetical protein